MKELKTAFEFLRRFHPEIDRVAFFNDSGWVYMTETHEVVSFKFPSEEIEEEAQSILEDAWDNTTGGTYIYVDGVVYDGV